MQLSCPSCGTQLIAEHINIQRLVAVCPTCHTVFQFDPSEPKIKRRKMKQPREITINESDSVVEIAFRTNFRLDQNGPFIGSALLSLSFTFLTVALTGATIASSKSPIFAVGFGLVTLALYYWFALVAYNKSSIEIRDESIKISRKPLPSFFQSPTSIAVSGIDHIRYEETAASKKLGYDTPRFHVWAEMVNGHHKLIVPDMIEDYAVYLSQQLNELLELDTPAAAASRLQEDDLDSENEQPLDESIPTSTKSQR